MSVVIRKPKVPISSGVKAFRGVGIIDVDPKVARAEQRRAVRSTYESNSRSNAHGGLRKRGTDLAVLTLTALQRVCKQHGLSCIAMFQDVVSAFDNMDRAKVFGTSAEGPSIAISHNLFCNGRALS